MTTIQFLTSKEFGCCTTTELLALNRISKEDVQQLKEYARKEMEARGIPITEQSTN